MYYEIDNVRRSQESAHYEVYCEIKIEMYIMKLRLSIECLTL